MNKKFKNLFLAGALILGFAGVAVSCTDYDDDINKLQTEKADKTELSALQQTVSGLQTSINAGYVITGVSALSGEPGGWRFTTSDGKTYDVFNGKDGKNGENGTNGENGKDGKDGKDGKPGDFYTPNAETGTWFLHTVGEDGEEVVTDTEQPILPEGFITVEYDPETNAVVIKVGEEEHSIALNGSSASFVFVPQVLVDGVNGMEITSIGAWRQALAAGAKLDDKSEKWDDADEVAVDGKDAWDVMYKEIEDNKIEFKTEAEEEDYTNNWMMEHGYLIMNNLGAVAQYHVNSDIVFDETAEYAFTTRDNKVLTRVESSEDFAMTAEFISCEDGILTVGVGYVGRPAGVDPVTGTNHMTRFALQVTKDGKTYTSDYATFVNTRVTYLAIADPKAVVEKCKPGLPNNDEHYRRGEIGIANVDAGDAYRPDVPVWTPDQTTNDEAGLAKARATCDTVVKYDGSIDLATITAVHYFNYGDACTKPSGCYGCYNKIVSPNLERVSIDGPACEEMTEEEMAKFGLYFEYEIVKNYKIGKPVTDQADFVKLDGSVFTPRVYSIDGSIASVGRTPIVRVKLMLNGEIVKVSYIKIYIDKTDSVQPTFELIPRRDAKQDGENVFHFSCDGDSLYTTVQDMNEIVYHGTNLYKEQFHTLYDSLTFAPQKDTIGTLEDVCIDPVEGTHVIKWKITAQDLWKISGNEVAIIARYFSTSNPNLYVDIKLTASVADAIKKVELLSAKGDYIKNYWTDNFEATKYNVNTPAQGETDPNKCVFGSDINASFVTYERGTAEEGKLLVPTVDSVYYFFCAKDIKKITSIGDLAVKFRVGDNGDSLFASILDAKGTPVKVKDADGNEVTEDLVAYIDNEPITVGVTDPYTVWNTFYWVKGVTTADSLLNTGKMYTYIGAKAFQCTEQLGEDARELDVTFDGEDHFRANVVRPLEVANKAADGFVDAVNFGTKGSYIKVEDLLDPVDWRGLKFSDNTFFWDYYGPFNIVLDIAGAECNLNDPNTWIKVPRTIILTQTDPKITSITDPIDGTTVTLVDAKGKALTEPVDINGYLTYKNNKTVLTGDFQIRIKAKISYGFGWFDTDWIYIDVAKTIGPNTNN